MLPSRAGRMPGWIAGLVSGSLLALLLSSACALRLHAATPAPTRTAPTAADLARWQAHAAAVTITRDRWGIAHVRGHTDADAIFGFLYAQAEDDFNRVELNYVNALGRLAEIEGESALDRDLRMKLFIDPSDLQTRYAGSPAWLKALMDAWADGLNYFLHSRPDITPKLITHFEPWMALAFTEGSIGGDIESIALAPLGAFYRRVAPTAGVTPAVDATKAIAATLEPWPEPTGSNGFAIAPARSASGHALLMINPHTSFYFRPEIHVASDAGLNAYGAVTWGQIFIYQGFNERVGWMHTSGGADVIDEYAETVVDVNGAPHYRYGEELRPFRTRRIELPYRTADGGRAVRTITAYSSHRGPVIRTEDGKWIAVALMQNPVDALAQSYLRTKARSFEEFRKTMELRTNSSNNTVYADADGTIAYFHGNFVPKRDLAFDWRRPVDGSNPATDWQGLHSIDELIALRNPSSGWIQNTNNWPFSAAGAASPRREDYPRYFWQTPSPGYAAENPRGVNAVRLLSQTDRLSLEGLIALAYDPTLTAFEYLLPPLFAAYDTLPARDPRKARLADPVAALRAWDHRTGVDSVPTTLAVLWAQDLADTHAPAIRARGAVVHEFLHTEISAEARLQALERTLDRLERDFGGWRTPWGEINRFQRLDGEVRERFDDNAPSLPVGFAPSTWGSLAAYGTAGGTGTKRIYGNRGNSFVAAVEFGPRVRARTLLAGGVSGDPKSAHFTDQAERYTRGEFKEALFHPEDIAAGAVRTYRPGERTP